MLKVVRCPKGTRRNKKTGLCEPNKRKSKTPVKPKTPSVAIKHNIKHFISDIDKIPAQQKNDGLQCYLHCVLIDKGVRDGWLFQYINIITTDGIIESPKEHKTSDKIIAVIKEYFPNKFFYLENDQGLLISKREISIEEFDDNDKIGEILGYPCKYGNDGNDGKQFSVSLNFISNKNISNQIFGFRCSSINDKTKVEKIKEKIKSAIKGTGLEEYIREVNVEFNEILDYTLSELTDILMNPNKIDDNFIDYIGNQLYNSVLHKNNELYFMDYIEFDNEKHRMILLTLFTYGIGTYSKNAEHNEPESCFDETEEEEECVSDIYSKREKAIIKLFQITSNRKMNSTGGKMRKTNKRIHKTNKVTRKTNHL